MKKNQRGLTLVEVLATLVILSIAGVLIWSIFFQGLKFSQNAVSKNMMIQEANIVISNLKKIHQTSSEYNITSIPTDCEIVVEDIVDKATNTPKPNQVFNHTQLCISSSFTGVVDTKLSNEVPIDITIKDNDNLTNKVLVNTVLHRFKEGDLVDETGSE